MEGKLGRLGEGTQKDKQQGRDIKGMGADDIAHTEDYRDLVTAGNMAEEEKPGQHCQPASTGDCQSHSRALAGFGALVAEADEQKRAEGCQLPEDKELQQVVGEDDADHGPHEEEQRCKKATGVIILGQVIVGIEDNQQTDSEDQQDKQGGQSVHPQDEIETGLGQPGTADRHRSPPKGGKERIDGKEQGGGGHGSGRPGRCPASQRSQPERQQGPGKGQQNNEQQVHVRSLQGKSSSPPGTRWWQGAPQGG